MSIQTIKQGALEYLTAEGISVPHCFTTRFGGVSEGQFDSLNIAIKDETIRRMFLVRLAPQQEVKRERVAKETGTAAATQSLVKKQPVRKDQKVGPNDPCPCGSGKKYKKCCMQKDKMAE